MKRKGEDSGRDPKATLMLVWSSTS